MRIERPERQFLCSVIGLSDESETAVYAATHSKARYKFWREVTDAWPDVPITSIKVRAGARPTGDFDEWKRLGLTEIQRELVRHALGFARGCKQSYRNRYVASPGAPDHCEWLDLAGKGLAIHVVRPPLFGDADIFYCTKRLALAVRGPYEHLDPEFYDPEASQ